MQDHCCYARQFAYVYCAICRFPLLVSIYRQIDRQTNRPTDHATRSVTIGRIYWDVAYNNKHDCSSRPMI